MSNLTLKFHSTDPLRGTKELPNHKNGPRRIVSLHDLPNQKLRRSSGAFSNEKLTNDTWGDEDFTKRDNLTLRSRTSRSSGHLSSTASRSSGHLSSTASGNEIRFGIDTSLSLRRRDTTSQPAPDDAQPPATKKPSRNKHNLQWSTLELDTEEINLALQQIQEEDPFRSVSTADTNKNKRPTLSPKGSATNKLNKEYLIPVRH